MWHRHRSAHFGAIPPSRNRRGDLLSGCEETQKGRTVRETGDQVERTGLLSGRSDADGGGDAGWSRHSIAESVISRRRNGGDPSAPQKVDRHLQCGDLRVTEAVVPRTPQAEVDSGQSIEVPLGVEVLKGSNEVRGEGNQARRRSIAQGWIVVPREDLDGHQIRLPGDSRGEGSPPCRNPRHMRAVITSSNRVRARETRTALGGGRLPAGTEGKDGLVRDRRREAGLRDHLSRQERMGLVDARIDDRDRLCRPGGPQCPGGWRSNRHHTLRQTWAEELILVEIEDCFGATQGFEARGIDPHPEEGKVAIALDRLCGNIRELRQQLLPDLGNRQLLQPGPLSSTTQLGHVEWGAQPHQHRHPTNVGNFRPQLVKARLDGSGSTQPRSQRYRLLGCG